MNKRKSILYSMILLCLAATVGQGQFLQPALTDPAKQAEWDDAYELRLRWDGGDTGLVPATGRTSLELGTAAVLDVGVAEGDVPQLGVGGVLDGGRISDTSVTQHEASINHNALLNHEEGEHRTINDAGTAVTDLWSGSKIDTELGGKADLPTSTVMNLSSNKTWQASVSGDELVVNVQGDHTLTIDDPADVSVPMQISVVLVQQGTNEWQAVLSGNLVTQGGVSLATIQSTSEDAVDSLRFEWLAGANWLLRYSQFDIQ